MVGCHAPDQLGQKTATIPSWQEHGRAPGHRHGSGLQRLHLAEARERLQGLSRTLGNLDECLDGGAGAALGTVRITIRSGDQLHVDSDVAIAAASQPGAPHRVARHEVLWCNTKPADQGEHAVCFSIVCLTETTNRRGCNPDLTSQDGQTHGLTLPFSVDRPEESLKVEQMCRHQRRD